MMAAQRLKPGMPLGQLLSGWAEVPLAADVLVTGVALDSRRVQPGDVFLAYRGASADGRAYVADALHAGAVAVIVEGDLPETLARRSIAAVSLPGLAQRAGEIAARFHGNPSASMNVIGITGTNGKTSIASYIAQVLSGGGAGCGLFGTLGYGRYGQLHTAITTTPDAVTLQRLLVELLADGIDQAVMEVSSHALAQGRVNGMAYRIAVFTNLSRDHLDYHADMNDYAAAKRKLFEWPGLQYGLLNMDDAFGREWMQLQTSARLFGYSLEDPKADLYATISRRDRDQMALAVTTPWGSGELTTALSGRFNAANLLATLGAVCLSGVPFEQARQRLAHVQPAPGRMQSFGGEAQPRVVVDYAHTPDALAQALITLRAETRGELWCVFGCGGDRDRGKRPLMAAAAEAHADHLLLTSDNPRTEAPQQILDDLCAGLKQPARARMKIDRALAIRAAIQQAAAADTVLVAGKGHEDYQDVAGVRHPFSDADIVRRCLEQRS